MAAITTAASRTAKTIFFQVGIVLSIIASKQRDNANHLDYTILGLAKQTISRRKIVEHVCASSQKLVEGLQSPNYGISHLIQYIQGKPKMQK